MQRFAALSLASNMANLNTNQNEPLGLLSLNANGLGEIKKRRSVMLWLKKFHNADKKIIFLQETHTTKKSEIIWEKEWNYRKIIFSHGTAGSTGAAIIFPKHMNYQIKDTKISKEGRYVAVMVTIENNEFCLINCYAPNCNNLKGQLKWLEEIQQILEENLTRNCIIGGDLNDVFIPYLDRYKCKPNAVETEYVKAWKILCDELNLTDIWRVLNPDKKQYTWRQGSSTARLKQSRLDY
jgi:exonuclease III